MTLIQPLKPTTDDPTDPTLPTEVPPVAAATSATPVTPAVPDVLPTIRPTATQIPALRPYQVDPSRAHYESALANSLYNTPAPKPQGFFGKAGHILSGIGNAVGDVILGENNMAAIPGTTLNRAAQRNAGIRQLAQLQNEDQAAQDDTARRNLELTQTQALPASEAAKDNLENAQADRERNPLATTPFELWHSQNPTGTVQGFLAMQEKPISQQDADARNGVWDKVAQQYGLPSGQFKPGMSLADANALAGELNNVISRNQSGQKIVIENKTADSNAENRRDSQTQKDYDWYRNEWTKKFDTYDKQRDQINEANTFISKSAMGDAIGAIKSLSSMAAGMGSGVRITQAELNSIVHARGYGGDAMAWLQKFGDGRNLTPDQEGQLKSVLGGINSLAARKESFMNRVLDDLGDARDIDSLRKIDSQARAALAQ